LQNQKFTATRKRGKSNPRGKEGEKEREREEGGREERRGVPPRALGHPCW